MLERYERALKIACIGLAALMLYQLVRLAVRRDPLANLNIPALPSLPPAADERGVSVPTNSLSRSNATKQLARISEGRGSTTNGTNTSLNPTSARTASNSVPGQTPKPVESNSTAQAGSRRIGTNSVASRDAVSTGAVAIPRPESGGRGLRPGLPLDMPMADMNPMSGAGPGRRGPPLPPDVQARVDRITDSEILAPVVRPMPMALLGIAGPFVFLRAPNGQTGMVKEGDGLGELKLLSIGINRVLVEQDGQKKELTIFSGFGGETLLPKEKDKEKESPK